MLLPENFWIGALSSSLFGLMGIALLILGFKIFDWLMPKLDFQQELKSNPIAIAIVIGSFFYSIAHIIACCLN